MVPFLFILFELFVGLRGSIKNQPEEARGLVNLAIWVTVLSWSFYPVVYFAPLLFGAGNANIATMSGDAAMIVQVGYTIADVTAKCLFGLLIYGIARTKSFEDDAAFAEQEGGHDGPARGSLTPDDPARKAATT